MKWLRFICYLIITFSFHDTKAQGTWTKKENFGGSARDYAVGFSIGNKGYIGTGNPDNGAGAYKDFWEYDPVLNTWTQKADFGGQDRWGAIGFSIGNKGYVGTGLHDSPDITYLKDFWEYDPVLNTWSQKADFGGPGRREAVGFSIGGMGYVGTGVIQNFGYSSDFWEYDPVLNTWTQKADFAGTVRYAASGFSLGSKGYLGIGYEIPYPYDLKKDFWEYDPLVDNWTQKADFGGTARAFAVGFAVGSRGYLGMGYGVLSIETDLWEYDPSDNIWQQKADFVGIPRLKSVGFSICNKGYAGTGMMYDYSSYEYVHFKDFWEYNPGYVGLTIYADEDGDGFGNINNSNFTSDCDIPNGYVADSSDCNDADSSVYPGALEIANNNIDDNCDGYIDEFGTGVEDINSTFFFSISPNPSNAQATIQFILSQSCYVRISLLDLSGKEISRLINDEMKKGEHSVSLNTAQFSKGVYLVSMISEQGIVNQKLVIQ